MIREVNRAGCMRDKSQPRGPRMLKEEAKCPATSRTGDAVLQGGRCSIHSVQKRTAYL